MANTKSRRSAVHGLAIFVVAGAAAAPAAANPPALTIPECAQASTIRSTIDPKKKDAKQKTEQAARLQQICNQKYAAASRASAAQPASNTRAQPAAQPRKSSALGGLGSLFNVHTTSSSAPQYTRTNANTVQLFGPAAAPGTQYASAPAPAPPPAATGATTTTSSPSANSNSGATATAGGAASSSTLTPDQLNVFGVQLYESLKLPACAQGVVELGDAHSYESAGSRTATSPSAPCAETSTAAQPIAQRFAGLDGGALPRNVKFALVRLPSNRCPSWMSASCTLGVVSQGGIVVGVSFLTDPARDRTVEQTITSKFGSSPSGADPAKCDAASAGSSSGAKSQLTDRTWDLTDLMIRYRPLNGLTCSSQGRVFVDATPMKKLRDQRSAASDKSAGGATAEPKM
ncbi:MAG TPA: hypothetical protein VMI54_30885 [Polyangiaceae bacterium]|nr:hypothetical protein [Polyangiaceae bacterium]